MKTNAIKRIAILLLLITSFTLAGYRLSYPIELNRATLPEHIKDLYNHGRHTDTSPTIVLYGGVSIGNKEYYLIEIGENLGSVTLERGLTGRYKFTHLGYGDGNFLDGIIESEGKKYLLLGGRDITSQISKVAVFIDGQTYELYHENATDHFLLYTEIDDHVKDRHVNRDYIRLYNKKGEDITELYNLNGGGIQ